MFKTTPTFKTVLEFIYRYKFSILFLLYCCIIVLIPVKFSFNIPVIINALSFFFILNIIAKLRFAYVYAVLLILILSINAYFSITYGGPISVGAIASIFETNKVEASSMLKEVLIPGSIILLVTSLLVIASVRELRAATFSIKKSVIFLLVYCLVFIPVVSYAKLKSDNAPSEAAHYQSFAAYSLLNSTAPLLYGNIGAIFVYKREMDRIKQYVDVDRKIPEGIVLNDEHKKPKKIFLIIGESALRKHYSLYGYNRPTTPFLDSLNRAENSGLNFYNAISPASLTRDALRIILSFCNSNDMNPFFENKNMVELASMVGYETVWISNQAQMGPYSSYFGYIATCSDETFFTHDDSITLEDLNLIPVLNRKYKSEEYQFIVIHLMGSHMSYSDKYDDIDTKALPGDKSVLNEYDRSIHHTDRVMEEIYKVAQQDSSFLICYFSDHGEIIGQGHGISHEKKSQFEIPLVTINNSSVPIDSIMQRYVDPQSSLINTSSMIYIMSEIFGYTVPAKYVEQAIEDGRSVRHPDWSVSRYSEMKED